MTTLSTTEHPRWLRPLWLVSTGAVTLWMAISGTLAVSGAEAIVSRITHLGYPESFALLLGLAKLGELAAILLPVPPRLREWAYAGSSFEAVSAAYAYAAAGAGVGEFAVPFVILAVVQTSFWTGLALSRDGT